ncbi:hypothetical protein MMC26_007179 [Xylographa opegraphella]|nr:hypothetical protein [Xylographa opegraphella]
MQVSVIADTPNIMWYFVAALPMMLAVFASWYFLKQFLDGSRRSPYARGIYEALFQHLATNYPQLWTRTGPRRTIRLSGRFERIKWWLILYWSTPKKTAYSGPVNDDSLFDGLGTWSRLKRRFIRQWTSEIHSTGKLQPQALQGTGRVASTPDGLEASNVLVNMAQVSTSPETGILRIPFDLNKRVSIIADSSRRSGSAGRPSTSSSGGRKSGVMVEEERLDWLENP